MRIALLGLGCLIATYAWCEEEVMTTLSQRCEDEQCVEQLCNPDKSYCKDSPYIKKDNEKISLSRNVEQDQIFYLSLISNEETTNTLGKQVQQIALSDGSKWEVDQNFASMAKGWKGGDHISINVPHAPGGMLYPKDVFNLQNESTLQAFPAKLSEVDAEQSQKIVSFDPDNLQVCLSNKMCLKAAEKNSWIFSVIKPGSSIVLGLNTDLDAERFPILLLVSTNRGEAIHWMHIPVKLDTAARL